MVEGVVVGSIKWCAQGKLSGVAKVGVGAGWGRRPGRLEKEIESRERLVLYYCRGFLVYRN